MPQNGIQYFSLLLALLLWSCQQPTTSTSSEILAPEKNNAPNNYTEKHRPQYHFSPPEQWMNDPNGMVFYEDEYHLFYQHYPDSNVWGPMHWGHAVSPDLVHWEQLPIALYPDSLGYIFSGSAVIDWKNTSGLGVNGNAPMIAIYTYHDPSGEKAGRNDFQYQGLAYSNDKGRTWTKYSANPIIPNRDSIRDFRDPKVIWDQARQQWLMVFAAFDYVQIWTSKNLREWTHRSDWGKEFGNHGGVWECPDLFPIVVAGSEEKKWVLLLSINPGGPNGGSATQYFVGDFDGANFKLDPSFVAVVENENAVWLDYGRDNYAGVTWSDIPASDGRRLFMGWMSNWDYAQVVPTEKWRSAMTSPRSLVLQKQAGAYRLTAQVVKELETLRKQSIEVAAQSIEGKTPMSGAEAVELMQAAYVLEFSWESASKPLFGIEWSNAAGERYRLGYNTVSQELFSDRTQAGPSDFSDKFAVSFHRAPHTSKAQRLRLHCYLDASSIEIFADEGTTVMTEILFPVENFNQLHFFSEGGPVQLEKAKIYPLRSIWN